MMLSISSFNIKKASSTGGVTGSTRVLNVHENHFYQLKKSILDAPATRKLKAGGTDRENFGEVIAANIGYAFLGDNKVPKVKIVYDGLNERTLIASKYLNSQDLPPQTLDEHLANAAHLQKTQKHIKIVSKYSVDAPGYIKVNHETVKPLLSSLARSIVISMMTGDHDVNPGNMLVVYEGNPSQPTVARIDFGHAFNDLLNAPALFGGRVINKEHPSLDFFNRTAVAGFPHEAPSKLWRDYPGLIPSQELVNAMRDLAIESDAKLKAGINAAKDEFSQLLKVQSDPNYFNVEALNHTFKSLNAIYENLTGEKLPLPNPDIKSQVNHFLDQVFETIEKTVKTYIHDMKRTADILEVQVKIDDMIEFEKLNSNRPIEAFEEELSDRERDISQRYRRIDPHNQGIEWVRTDDKSSAFQGNLDEYINYRKPILGELIAQMQAKRDHYVRRVDNQLFSEVREGVEKKALIQKVTMAAMKAVNKGDLDEARKKFEEAKTLFKDTYGETKLLGLRKSAGFVILEELEDTIKKAQALSEVQEEHVTEGFHG